MKQFSLEEYLKGPSRKVVTRDGRPVRIICTDRIGGGDRPVVALYQSSKKYLGEIVFTFCANGEFTMGTESEYDLFFAPEKHEGWVNLYRSSTWNGIYTSKVFASEEEAKHNAGESIATIKVEWEE